MYNLSDSGIIIDANLYEYFIFLSAFALMLFKRGSIHIHKNEHGNTQYTLSIFVCF